MHGLGVFLYERVKQRPSLQRNRENTITISFGIDDTGPERLSIATLPSLESSEATDKLVIDRDNSADTAGANERRGGLRLTCRPCCAADSYRAGVLEAGSASSWDKVVVIPKAIVWDVDEESVVSLWSKRGGRNQAKIINTEYNKPAQKPFEETVVAWLGCLSAHDGREQVMDVIDNEKLEYQLVCQQPAFLELPRGRSWNWLRSYWWNNVQ